MRTNGSQSHDELLRECNLLWGRIQRRKSVPPQWHAQLNFDLLAKSAPRTLWTARDLLGEDGASNHGVVAQLGRYFKRLGFSRRVVRGLIDVRSCRVVSQCTLWRVRPFEELLIVTERASEDSRWRKQYHRELLCVTEDLKAMYMLIKSLCRDYQLDDPYRNPLEIRDSIESLKRNRRPILRA